jgi:hypothetical protein
MSMPVFFGDRVAIAFDLAQHFINSY